MEDSATKLKCEFVSRGDEGATVRWIEGVVPAIGCNHEVRLRPGTMKGPRTLHGTDDIVTTLHDDSRNVANPRRIFEQLGFGLHETLVKEIMGLDTRECEGEFILFEMCSESSVR